MVFVRKSLPGFVSTVTALIILLSRFFAAPSLKSASQRLLEWQVVVAAFALGLGAVNLIWVHTANIRFKRGRAWRLSYVTLAFLIVPTVVGIALTPKHPVYTWLFDSFYDPLGGSIGALLAFWICSACYRTFRIRNVQSVLLLASAIVVMIGRVGIGQTMWPFSTRLSEWIMNVPNSAVMRALGMVTALGMVAVGLRVVLGLERRALMAGEEQ